MVILCGCLLLCITQYISLRNVMYPVLHFSAVTMTAAALIGDQLILEEDYDETYIPSEQGKQWRGDNPGMAAAKEITLCPDYMYHK